MTAKPAPKPGRSRGKRIVNGVMSNVIIENGKVVENLGPVKVDSPPIQEKPNDVQLQDQKPVTEEKPKLGLPLVGEDGSYVNEGDQSNNDNIIKPGTKPNNTSQEQKPKSGIQLTPISMEEIGKIFENDQDTNVNNKSPTQEKVPVPEPIQQQEFQNTPISEPVQSQEPKNIPVSEPIQPREPKKAPILEPLKPPKIPEIKIPKIKINVPKETARIPRDISSSTISNKLDYTLTNSTYPQYNQTEVVGTNPQKADEETRTQQPKEANKTKERRKSMEEELQAELLNEKKFEQWLKEQKFRENLEKAARFAEETKQQFDEKIPELSDKIEEITGEVKGVDSRINTVNDRLNTVDKSVETACTGIDCIKTDVKKYQESQEALEKMVQDRFRELGEKVQSLEQPIFTCENCGEQAITPLSSYCPNCGASIHSWSDEEGQPIKGWIPYWKRMGREAPQ